MGTHRFTPRPQATPLGPFHSPRVTFPSTLLWALNDTCPHDRHREIFSPTEQFTRHCFGSSEHCSSDCCFINPVLPLPRDPPATHEDSHLLCLWPGLVAYGKERPHRRKKAG